MKLVNQSRQVIAALVLLIISGCVTSPPEQVGNVCDIFREKSGWYGDAKDARARWGVPISVSMAFMYQESRFVATAKPPRKKIFGVIPGPRPSDSYNFIVCLTRTPSNQAHLLFLAVTVPNSFPLLPRFSPILFFNSVGKGPLPTRVV